MHGQAPLMLDVPKEGRKRVISNLWRKKFTVLGYYVTNTKEENRLSRREQRGGMGVDGKASFADGLMKEWAKIWWTLPDDYR